MATSSSLRKKIVASRIYCREGAQSFIPLVSASVVAMVASESPQLHQMRLP
jgi:hypothetical protein